PVTTFEATLRFIRASCNQVPDKTRARAVPDTAHSGGWAFGCSSPWWHVKQVIRPRRDAPSSGLYSGKNCWLIVVVIARIRRATAFRGFVSLAKSPRVLHLPPDAPRATVMRCSPDSNLG